MKRIATIAAVFMFAVSANAQITLDESNIQALIGKRLVIFDYEASDTTGTYAISQQTGENETWDITGFTWVLRDSTMSDWYSSIAGTVGEDDPDFASANIAQVLSSSDTTVIDVASYSIFDSNGLYEVGFMGIFDNDGTIDTTKSVYTPPSLDVPFPFTYQTTVSDSVVHTQTAFGQGSFQDTTAKSGVVDGWGTLVTPDGSFDVLRYRYEERTYAFGTVSDETHYEWWGDTGPIFAISIDESIFGSSTEVNYSTVTVTDITSVDPDFRTTPENFALQQNYPNPFNPSTVIPFELKSSAVVELAVYDMLGRRIQTLTEGRLPAGSHTVSWEVAENLPGGIYIARLSVDGRHQSRTMTFLK